MDEWLAILQGASFVGLLIVTTVAGLQRGQVQNLKASLEGVRGDNADLRQRVEDRDVMLMDERTTRGLERTADQAKIAELQSAVAVLRDTVTAEVHWVTVEGQVEELQAQLANHHRDAMARLDAFLEKWEGNK